MKTLFNDGSSVPTAFVARGRQRVKQYNNNTVYLNNGDEFQIELFNPTTNKVLAKIELNGVSLDSGIVLRPGERVFLERYLNEARKFLFETYEIDKNNKQAMKAISNNGDIKVMFYCEYINTITYSPDYWSWESNFSTFNSTSCTLGMVYEPPSNTIMYSSIQSKPTFESLSKQSLETGRIEKGSNSNQSFTCDSTTFNTWWSWKSEWKILPFSQKPLVREDIKVFCTSCGAKRKKESYRFCPNCGTKY